MKSKSSHIVRAVSVKGPAHEARKMPCQDHFNYSKKGKNFVAVISDGAGSAPFGGIGAKIVCDTLVDLVSVCPFKESKKEIVRAVEIAREKLIRHRFNKTKCAKNLKDFAATVVGVVYNEDRGFLFHIGDGAGIAFAKDNVKNFVISGPENGRFACETFFYTMEDWRAHLRFVSLNDEDVVFLMSDGVSGFALSSDHKRIEECFLAPINDFLLKEKTKTKALKALTSTLCNKKAAKINSDDKTLLWVKL